MPTNLVRRDREATESRGPELAFKGVTLAVAGLLIGFRTPVEFILPVASLTLLLSGFAIALGAPRLPRSEHALSFDAVAGTLVLLGFGAAILSDAWDLTPLLASTAH